MKYPKWIGIEDSSFMCIDEDDSIPSKVIYDVNTSLVFFTYLQTEGCGCFSNTPLYNWTGLIIDELIDICLNRNSDIFSFSDMENILKQKIRKEKLDKLINHLGI